MFRTIVTLAALAAPALAQTTSFVLTDVATNIHLDDFAISAADLGMEGSWSVRRETLRGGKQEGVDRIVIDTGFVRAALLPTRGMSVQELRVFDQRIGWDSPSQEIVHPSKINLAARGGLGWLEGFNEWLVRCGLEFAGHPGEDEFVDNTGATQTADLTLHGRIGNLPARKVVLVIDEDEKTIRLQGIVDERTFYGPRLRLETEFSVPLRGIQWRVSDRVINVGAQPQEFQLIYHANYGPPFLGEGSKLLVPAKTIAPMNAKAAGAIDTWKTYLGPTAGFLEEVYLIEPCADEEGFCEALLIAPDGETATGVRWNVAELPYFTQWKNTAAVADGYVTGLEPGTGFPYNRRVERAAGRVPVLQPGESRSFTLDYRVYIGGQIEGPTERIRAIQRDRPTTIQGVPD